MKEGVLTAMEVWRDSCKRNDIGCGIMLQSWLEEI